MVFDVQNFAESWHCAWRDIRESFRKHHLVFTMARQEIATCYKRSRIGAFWISIGMAISIGCIGLVFGQIFKIPIREFLPYFASSTILWGFISSCLNEGCGSFISSTGIILQVRMPLFVHVMRLIQKNVIIFSGACWRKHHGRKLHPSDLVESEIFSHCAAAVLYRRSAFLEVGGFDEGFFCYMEDVDLGFRLRLRGYAAVFVPQATVEHASENRRGDFAVYHGHRNPVWCFFKNMPAKLLLVLCVPHVLQTLCAFFACALRGRAHVFIREKIFACRDLQKMLTKRRLLQSKRRISTSAIWLLLS